MRCETNCCATLSCVKIIFSGFYPHTHTLTPAKQPYYYFDSYSIFLNLELPLPV